MKAGDIFTGELLGEKSYKRYIIDRHGYTEIIPQWWVKEIESDEDNLLPSDSPVVTDATNTFLLMGKEIPFYSSPPAEVSHLEMYPQKYWSFREANRYIRGYIVNRTMVGYERLEVQFRFYDEQNRRMYQKRVNLFKVYPQTMKPFAVDTWMLDWDKVVRVRVELLSGVRMPPRTPYLDLD